jgi:hypothetical protein
MRRAILLFLALLAPALAARAQNVTPGSMTFGPAAIGVTSCNSNSNVIITFSVQPASAVTTAVGSVYRVFASTTAPTTSTGISTVTVCPSSAGQVGSDLPVTAAQQSVTVGAGSLVSAAGLQCSNTSNPTINVCVQFYASGTSTVTASATGTIPFTTQPPSAPYIWLVEPANGALFVHWNPGAGTAATSYQIVATPTAPAGEPVYSGKISSLSQNVEGRINGLTNGTVYSVTVIPFSDAGDQGPASNAVSGTPAMTAGFWDRYQGAGGKEQGGCASGPAGLGALLLAAAGLAGLRRRS